MTKRRLVVRRYRARLTGNHAKHITLGIDPTLLVVKV